MSQSTDVAQITELVTAWAQAITDHDLAATVAHHSDDILMFDVPTTALHGISEYRKSWQPFFPYLGATGKFVLNDLAVTAGDTVAFATAIVQCVGERSDELTVRLTVGLRKVDGEWTVTHEHHSVASP